ncbi:hypothetical protein FRB95_010941 [Tulasnella sp. JGI-2019a]|nr:hypothetical protein FRB95_010941 [Tulasnella sp. JGI-2019a]
MSTTQSAHGDTPVNTTDLTYSTLMISGIIQPDEIVIDPSIVASSSVTSRALWRNSTIAVKRLPQDVSRQAIADLVRRLQAVRHTRVQRLLGASHFPSGPSFLVTPYFENGNVIQYLAAHSDILPRNLAQEAAVGMEYLHMMNVVHGRLRPQNILVSNDGQACIGDPGLYHFSTTPASASYLSPEAWKGKVSKPSDAFAFSMVVYEMYTMGRPWGVLSDSQIYQLVVREDARPDRPGSDAPYQLTDSEWSTMERSWNSDANARPTFGEIVLSMSQPDVTIPTSSGECIRSTQPSDPSSLGTPNVYQSVNPLEAVHAPSISPAPPAYNSSPIDQGQRGQPSGVYLPSTILPHPTQSPSRIPRPLPWPGHQTLSSYAEERVHSPSTSVTPQLRDMPRHHSLNSSASQHGRRISSAPSSSSSPSFLQTDPSRLSFTPARPSAVIVAGALLSEITEGRKQEVIDRYLHLTQQLISQSEEEAQRFITAGIVPTLILLVKARAVDGVGIEIALKTLGMLAHDSLSSNTIFRTNTASILLEIVDSSDHEDAIALSLWCLSRISRGSEVAAGLVRKDIVSVLLRKGISRSPSTAQIASWCLGNLVYTDAMAETLVAQGAAPIMVDHLRKTLSSPSSQPDDPE